MRPHLFVDLRVDNSKPKGDLKNSVAPALVNIRSRMGSNPDYMDEAQRAAVFGSLFGRATADQREADVGYNFPHLRDKLLNAASTFAETKFGDHAALREQIRAAHIELRVFLQNIFGDSVRQSFVNLGFLAESVVYPILRNRGVANIYSINEPPNDNWPYTFDSQGNKLVQSASKMLADMQLMPPHLVQTRRDNGAQQERYITQQEFTQRQRAAIEGCRSIASVLELDPAKAKDADLDALMIRNYTWANALRALGEFTRPLTNR